MRIALILVSSLVLAGSGVVYAPGRPPSTDMLAARYSDSLPNPTHLGHWPAPTSGRVTAITPNMAEAGVGAGDVTFGVMVEGVGTVCSLSVPCTSGPLDFLTTACADTEIPPGAQVHLEFSHTCTTAPLGTVVFGFEWRR